MQRLKCFKRRKIGLSVAIVVESPSWLRPAKYSSKSSRVAFVTIANARTFCRMNTVGSDPNAREFDMMFVVRRLQDWRGRRTPYYTVALSTLPKHTTPSTEPFCGMSFLVLACHRQCSPSSANSTTVCKHACGWMMESARICSTWGKVSSKDACSCHCCLACFSRRYCVWPRNASSLMQPSRTTWCSYSEKKEGENKGTSRTAKVDGRRGEEGEGVQRLWGMLCADDAGIVSRSSEGLEGMMTVIMTACSSLGLTVSKKNTETRCLETKDVGEVPFTINAACQLYKQAIEFVYLGRAITADRDLRIEVTLCVQRTWAWFQRYKMEIFDRPGVRLRLKVRLLKAEVVETLLYGFMTWSPKQPGCDRLRRVPAPCYSDAFDSGNGSAATTPYRTPTRSPRQIPIALRR